VAHLPARDRKRRLPDPVTSLKQSVSVLAREIKRSDKLKSDIAAAVDARRYALYRGSTMSGTRAADCSLAWAQSVHLSGLLRFVHSIAAAGSDDRISSRTELDRLTESLRELRASLERARELSRNVLAQCQRRD
jgi:HAMP domain-containing protein